MPSSEVMHKWKTGHLHSGGPGGPKVKSQKQAVAIMMSEKRTEAKHGGHYPEKSYFQGGSTMAKSSGLHDASYADGRKRPAAISRFQEGTERGFPEDQGPVHRPFCGQSCVWRAGLTKNGRCLCEAGQMSAAV